MAGLSALAAPTSLLSAPPPVNLTPGAMDPTEAAKRAAIAKTAKAFEASFINSMLGSMFEGVTTSAPFGGGDGESAFKSFMTEAFAKQMTDRGGIGVAASVQREMLKLQGLS